LETITEVFKSTGLVAWLSVLWVFTGLLFLTVMIIVYAAAAWRKPSPSSRPAGGTGSALGGILVVLSFFVIVPAALNLFAKLATGITPDLLASASPEMRASLLARGIAGELNAVALTRLGQLLLSIEAAVLAGLALTVPFRRRRRNRAAGMGAPGGEP
jgi:hypothetical protein